MVFKLNVCLTILCCGCVSWASVKSDTSKLSQTLQSKITTDDISYGLTYQDLYKDYISIDQKWSLLKKILKGEPDFARKVFLSCLESSDWVLRSGGIQFLSELDPKLSATKALNLLKNDPALMVRSAALTSLERNGLSRFKADLWALLRDPKNFHKGQSLWIRKEIARNLHEISNPEDSEKWSSFLNDQDDQVVQYSVHALEKSSGMILGKTKDPVKLKAQLWKQRLGFY